MGNKIKSAIVWGDSVARGVVLDEQRERYKLLSRPAAVLVAEKLGIQVTNRSRMGLTSTEGMAIMEKDLERGVRADAAILEFGGNDCDFFWQEISETPDAVHLPRTSAEQYEKNMRHMIRRVEENGMTPMLVNLTPINADHYFRFVSRNGLSQENILRWLGDKFQIYRFQERYSMIVTKLAHECGCRLLDIRSAFLNVWDSTTSLFCRDGIHPTEKGQELIGNAILADL